MVSKLPLFRKEEVGAVCMSMATVHTFLDLGMFEVALLLTITVMSF